jgi:thiol-disulfide isomerase/thioredoxin
LVPGKLVLVEFYADWCAPCRILEPQIARRAELNPDALAVRKVDVINWESPVARQFDIGVLPYLRLYGPNGDLISDGDAAQVLRDLDSRLLNTGGTGVGDRGVPNRWILLAGAVVVAALIVAVFRGRATRHATGATQSSDSGQLVLVGDPVGGVRIWFTVVNGRLEGPLSAEQLVELRDRRVLDHDSKVRRRGEAQWQRLADVVEQERTYRI